MAVSLKDKLAQKAPELFEVLYNDYRPELNKNIHILDLGYESLKVNVYRGTSLSKKEVLLYDKIYNTLQGVVRQALSARTYTSIDNPKLVDYFSEKNKQQYIILVDNKVNEFFIVGKSFGSIREFVTKTISSHPQLIRTRFGTTYSYEKIFDKKNRFTGDYKKVVRSKVDIGHIPAEDDPNLTSPLEVKLLKAIEISNKLGNPRLVNKANIALKSLYDIQASMQYNFKNIAPEIKTKTQNVLGKGYIVVTLHTATKNNQFSKKEKALYDKLVAEAVLSLDVTNVPGSNTIIEDVGALVANSISGGKKPLKKHKEQNATIVIKKSRRIPLKSFGIQGPKVEEIKPQENLVGLQTIINNSLHDQIKRNMGTGNSRKVLNYKTGRFARSAIIERISQSKTGLISAFYNYMKYPYATFSDGGIQQYPKTRDPKLLISKSIRELAAPIVGSRLRAILV